VPAQNPVSFNAYLSGSILNIPAVNYSSAVQIEITGATVFNQFFNFGTSDTAFRELSMLPDGECRIRVITEGKGVFVGCFSAG